MPAICATYERVTRMHIYERTPYAGQLVFAAFSGSHQDAIAKGMAYRCLLYTSWRRSWSAARQQRQRGGQCSCSAVS